MLDVISRTAKSSRRCPHDHPLMPPAPCMRTRSSAAIARRARGSRRLSRSAFPSNGDAPHLLGWHDEAAIPRLCRGDLQMLTPTELDVLTDAANGLTRAESAAKRFKGSETVKTQRRSILLKLGARNMAQAVGMTHLTPARKSA